jgi:superfamily II DNA/RNA helicase
LTFEELGLSPQILDGISSMGYKTATPVQSQVIQPILAGRDILASAQTGTGKTAAFLLPIIHKLITEPHPEDHINALIIVPTRELAIQIAGNMEGLGYFTNVSSIAIYGGGDGNSFTTEKTALTSGVDIVVCTPGRMIAHLNMGYVNLKHCSYLVLDEADRMLDMGFLPDIQRVLKVLPREKQSLLFSATMPDNIFSFASSILKEPTIINIALSKPPSNVKQGAFVLFDNQKISVLVDYLTPRKDKSVIVFSSRKAQVSEIQNILKRKGFSSLAMSSDLEQSEREFALNQFRNQQCKILVATDVMSRGIDIKGVDVVINFDVPGDAEDYVHRIGRTGRAEAEGEAVTFIVPEDQYKFKKIETLIQTTIEKLPIDPKFGDLPEYNPKAQSNKKKPFKPFKRKSR